MQSKGGCMHLPSKLRVGHKVIPRLPHIGKQRLDLLVHDAAGNFLDRLTNLYRSHSLDRRFNQSQTHDVVPAPGGKSHAVSDESRIRV